VTSPRYRRAVRRAFGTVLFYREQWAVSGAVEPVPTPVAELPDPPHSLCAFARPWSPDREPSLWTGELWPLARALRMAGCGRWSPVLELRPALLDRTRLRPWRAYHVVLSPSAVVASPEHLARLNASAWERAAAWVVGGADELASLPGRPGLRPVLRLPVRSAADPAPDAPAVLFEPRLGYLGAVCPRCGRFHLDRHVYARERSDVVTLSLLGRRRLTLLDVVPPAAGSVRVDRCPRHGTQTLVRRSG
jgi:hypothetical protein